MGRFEVPREDRDRPGFVVVGPGEAAVDATEFLAWLGARGRGSYTLRTYALGLAHFLSWLDDQAGASLTGVDRSMLVRYVAAFRDGDGDRPLGASRGR